VYFEIYEPLLDKPDPNFWVAIRMVIQDAATGEIKNDTGGVKLQLQAGQTDTISRAYSVPVDKLSPGNYRVVVSAADSAEKQSQRSVDFQVQ
jgi:hypothetical protein